MICQAQGALMCFVCRGGGLRLSWDKQGQVGVLLICWGGTHVMVHKGSNCFWDFYYVPTMNIKWKWLMCLSCLSWCFQEFYLSKDLLWFEQTSILQHKFLYPMSLPDIVFSNFVTENIELLHNDMKFSPNLYSAGSWMPYPSFWPAYTWSTKFVRYKLQQQYRITKHR